MRAAGFVGFYKKGTKPTKSPYSDLPFASIA